MNKEKLLSILVILLIVLNLGIVAFLFKTRPPHPPELWRMVVNELHFNAQQEEQYQAVREKHRERMNAIEEEFASVLEQYMNQLKEAPNPAIEDTLLNKLAELEKEKAAITLAHFRDVKGLCHPEQLDAFDQLIPQLLPVILPPKNMPSKNMLLPRRN